MWPLLSCALSSMTASSRDVMPLFYWILLKKCLLRKIIDVIDTIKSELEKACPGVVCCADILVLAARDCVALAGGPHTGRRDSTLSFRDLATYALPSPEDDLPQTLASFASRGFDERETVSLFGAHSIGMIHCPFFKNRLYNFSGTHKPDPSLDVEFLRLMRSRCNNSHSVPASAQKHPFYGFVSSTRAPSQFHINSQQPLSEDAGMAMMKLSDLQVLTTPMGQIWLNYSKAV